MITDAAPEERFVVLAATEFIGLYFIDIHSAYTG